jgi:hypothetical protein
MSGYGTKLVRLLGKGWVGPHGAGGRYWDMADRSQRLRTASALTHC